jgi:O-antigen/teichoic acid export membrane protein
MFKKILKNLSIYSMAPIITGLVGFLLLPIKSNYLTPSDYGVLGILTSINNFVAIIISLQVGSGLLRYYADITDKDERKKYLGAIFLLLLILDIIIISIFAIIFYFGSAKIFKSGEILFYPHISMQLMIIFLNQFTIIPSTIFVVNQSSVKKVLISLLAFAVNTGLSMYFIISMKMGARGILLAGIISGIVLLPLYIYITLRNSTFNINISFMRKTIIYSLPFIPACLAEVIYSYSDRYIIERFMTLNDVGIYTFAQTIVGPLAFILIALDSAFIPMYFESRKNEGKQLEMKGLMEKLTAILGLGIIIWVYFITEIKYFTSLRFIESFQYVALLSGFWFFRYIYIFPVAIILYHKKTKYIPFINLAPAIINIFLNIILVPLIGINGAALSTLICSIITLILTYYFSNKIEQGNFDYIKISITSIIIVIFLQLNSYIMFENFIAEVLIKSCLIIIYLMIVNKYYQIGLNIQKLRLLLRER